MHHNLSNQSSDSKVYCELSFVNLFQRNFSAKDNVESKDQLNKEDDKDILEITLGDLVVFHSYMLDAKLVHLAHKLVATWTVWIHTKLYIFLAQSLGSYIFLRDNSLNFFDRELLFVFCAFLHHLVI